MNEVSTRSAHQLAAMDEAQTIAVLQNSLYPGAAVDSIRMVLGYCQAAGLDPFQKPVHIVPMYDSKAGRMRDVIMPGVNLYRTQAARSGQFAGMSEPEFGPDVTQTIGGMEITYPEWCRVTVKRSLANGIVAEFVAREYWLENYAVKGGREKSIAPNAMWQRRPRGQISKCASAQALRIAFPEIASQPTAEEMEGKTLHVDEPADIPPTAPAELVGEARHAATGGVVSYQAFWQATGAANRKLLAGHHNAMKANAQAADAARTVEVEPADDLIDDNFVRDMEAAEGAEEA